MIYRRHKIREIVCLMLIACFFFLIRNNKAMMGLQIKLFSSLNFLRAETTDSKKTVALLAEIDNLRKENTILKEFLSAKADSKILPVGVLLGGGFLFTDKLFIDVGENASVKKMDRVTDNNNFLIGFVDEVGSDWSRVGLLTEIGSKMPLRLGGNKDIIFEAEGIGGGEIAAQIPNSVPIKIGEVVWSGEDQDYVAGIVDRIRRQDADPFQKLYIVSPVSARFLREVFVTISK